jgi:hypothetical protein
MEDSQPQKPAKRSLGARIFRIVKRVLMGILLLMVILFLLILTPPVQNFIKGKLTNYLEDKLGTRVDLGRVFIRLNGDLALDDLYMEDQQGDSLLSVHKLRASVNLWGLIRGADPNISSVEMDGVRIRVHRRPPDSVFNYQYIIDAFASAPDASSDTSSSGGTALRLGRISLSDIHIRYADYQSGNDLDVYWQQLSSNLERLDLASARYAASQTVFRGLNASFIRRQPVNPPALEPNDSLDTAREAGDNPMLVLLDDLLLEDANLQYRDSVTALYSAMNSRSLQLHDLKLDLDSGAYGLQSISLSSTRLQYDDLNAPRQKQGIDYAHLNADVSDLMVENFFMQGDSIAAAVNKLALKEQSGFELQSLRTDLEYGASSARLRNLDLRTPGTHIQRELEISYPSIEALSQDPAAAFARVELEDTRVAVQDILYFAPDLSSAPLFSNPSASWNLNLQASGTVNNIFLDQAELNGPEKLSVNMSGRLQNLTNWQEMIANLNIENISASKAVLQTLIRPEQLPSTIELPMMTRLSGTVKGSPKKMNVDIGIRLDQGEIDMKGVLTDLQTPERMSYDVVTDINQLNLAYLLKDTASFGSLTGRFDLNGMGTKPEQLRANLKAEIESVDFSGYTYRNWPLEAEFQEQILDFSTGLKDPNLHFRINGNVNLQQDYPALKMTAFIDSAKLQELGLSADPWIIRTGMEANFNNLDPDALDGELNLQQLLLVKEQDRLQLDTVALSAGMADSGRYLRLRSEIASAELQGNYQLSKLVDVIAREIEPYYSLGLQANDPGEYDFTLTATLTDRPLLRALLPGLESAKGFNLTSHFSNDQPLEAKLVADEISYNGTLVKGLSFDANPSDSALNAQLRLASLQSGALVMDSSIVNAKLANDQIDWDATIKDPQGRNRYRLGANISQGANEVLLLRMEPQNLLLNYEEWQMSDSNQIRIGPDGIWARDFELRKGNELLRLHSKEASAASPMHVSLKNFHVSSLTSLVLNDSSKINGTLDAEIDVRNLTSSPVFAGELKWSDLSFGKDTVGHLTAQFTNASNSNLIRADVKLSGRGNDVAINGTYNAEQAALDLQMDIERLPMKTAEAFAGGSIRNTRGYVSGPFRITGPVSAPNVKGELGFYDAGLNISMLNSYFSLNQQTIAFTGEGVRFNNFQVKDSTGNTLTLDGNLQTDDYMEYAFDLDIRARNFRALNSTKKDNKLFWGQLYFNTNLRLEGTSVKPVIDGRITVNDKTKMTVLLPQPEPGVVDRAGVIEFVDMDAPLNDSLFLAAYDSLNVSELTGMDVSLNVTIDKGADFTLIIDEGNGDFLNVKGEAQLNTGIDPSGKVTMVGTYELDQGAYELSFNMLRKKFNIQKGSRIVWEGEPTKANVDITAKYIANTAPLDLVKGQLDENISTQERNMYLQELPFEVNLIMKGELLRPQISFNIVLPDNKNYGVANDVLANVRTKLEQLRQSAGDMNKQVFSLLLLNRFVAENPFSSLASGGSATNMLKQSVSKLLTEQLNRLAEGLIEGVDINLGVESKDDYSTGEKQERTDLTVGLSKSLLNDRLTVSVGSNFALEGTQAANQQANNIAGNVAIDYTLSRDGRYKLRAYRKNDYQGVIDGYVVETGVSFIITLDYNKFAQIFRKRKRSPDPAPSPDPTPSPDPSLKGGEKETKSDPDPAPSSGPSLKGGEMVTPEFQNWN